MLKITSYTTVGLLLFCLLLPGGISQAASLPAYSVTKNYVQLDFPDRLTFHLAALSSDVIQSVTLLTGNNGRACQPSHARRLMDFTPANHVDLSWDLQFQDYGLLPPGTQVWWQWVVTTSGGITDTTPLKSYVINDQRANWNKLEEVGITLQWQQGSQEFGNKLLAISEKSLQRLEMDMGVAPAGNIWITIYPSTEALQNAAHAYEWTGGVAYPAYNSTMIGIAPDDLDWAAEVIPHELSHLLVDARVFNCHGAEVPTWLGEGLAVYAENGSQAESKNQVLEALSKGYLPDLDSLAGGFSAYTDSASLAYAESSQVVTYLIQAYGAQKIGRLLNGLHSGQTIDEALSQAYGLDTNSLDAAWRASLGFPAQNLPTQVPVLMSSSTAVPTLPLATSLVKPSPTFQPPTPTPASSARPQKTPTPTPVPVAASSLFEKLTPLSVVLCLVGLIGVVSVVRFFLLRAVKKPQEIV